MYEKCLASVRTSENWRLGQVLFDLGESPITLFIPSNPVGFLKDGEQSHNGFKWSVNREINSPRAANRPISCCTLFLELGARDSKIALS